MHLFNKRRKHPMVTTENIDNTPSSNAKVKDIAKDDVKAMQADYIKGASISTIATDYGYTEAEVSAAVVKDEAK